MRRIASPKKAALIGCVFLAFVTGCTDDTPVQPVQPKAVLDYGAGTISWPLDQFVMSNSEQNIVQAARDLVYVLCVAKVESLSDDQRAWVDNIVRSKPYPQWIWGFWSPGYIARWGYSPVSSAGPADWPTGACSDNPDYDLLIPMGPMDQDPMMQAINAAYRNSTTVASQSSTYASLKKQMETCLAAFGYQSDDAQAGAMIVKMGAEWAEQERLRAAVAAASCDSGLGITQALADIAAVEQQNYIDLHGKVLQSVRDEAERRVARARSILTDAGITIPE